LFVHSLRAHEGEWTPKRIVVTNLQLPSGP
jgi:hypothetical protein